MEGDVAPGEYPHSISSSDGTFTLYWKLLSDNVTVELAGRAAVLAWVGVGISQTGDMVPGDFIIVGRLPVTRHITTNQPCFFVKGATSGKWASAGGAVLRGQRSQFGLRCRRAVCAQQ